MAGKTFCPGGKSEDLPLHVLLGSLVEQIVKDKGTEIFLKKLIYEKTFTYVVSRIDCVCGCIRPEDDRQ